MRRYRTAALATHGEDWHSGHVIGHVISLAPAPGGNRDANHVPGVVLTGVVIGTLLLWAAVRTMFGKKKK